MKQLRVGVIGLGGVGRKLLEQFVKHPNIEVERICDINGKLAAKTSKKFNIPWTLNYDNIVKDSEIDLVYVAVPPKYHYEIVMKAIQEGKHVFCEKPLANSLEDARKMYEAAQEAGIVHGMNFPTPYRSAFKVLKEKVMAHELGTLKRIEVKAHFQEWPRAWQQNEWIASRDQGGFTREVMPHYIHMIQHLFGNITVLSSTISYPPEKSKSENSLVATMKLDDGTMIVLDAMTGAATEENIRFTFFGTEGTASLVDWTKLEFGLKGKRMQELQLESINHLYEMINQVVLTCKGEKAELFTFKEGLEVQEVLEKLLIEK